MNEQTILGRRRMTRGISIRNCFVMDSPAYRGIILAGIYAGEAGASARQGNMGVNQPVLDIAYVSKDTGCNQDLQQILGAFANPFVSATPRVALEEWKRASCEHALIVIDGYALGREALELCRRLRLAGVTKPIILAWIHSTDLDRAVCREFGASSVISRPFEPNKVAASIRAAATDPIAVDQSYGMGTGNGVRRQPSCPPAAMVKVRERGKAESIPVG